MQPGRPWSCDRTFRSHRQGAPHAGQRTRRRPQGARRRASTPIPRVASAENNRLRVGRLTKAHGLKGAIKIELYTDEPEKRFVPGARFSLQVPESSPWHGKSIELTELRWYNTPAGRILQGRRRPHRGRVPHQGDPLGRSRPRRDCRRRTTPGTTTSWSASTSCATARPSAPSRGSTTCPHRTCCVVRPSPARCWCRSSRRSCPAVDLAAGIAHGHAAARPVRGTAGGRVGHGGTRRWRHGRRGADRTVGSCPCASTSSRSSPSSSRCSTSRCSARRAQSGLIELGVHDLRDFTHDRHRTVDDTPYGGGAGMVMKPEPWGEALDGILDAATPS